MRTSSFASGAASKSRPSARAGSDAAATDALASLHQRVFPVLHREQAAGALVDAGPVLFREVVDALAGGDLALGQQRLADGFAEFTRAGLAILQRHRDHTLQHQERIVGVAGELAAAVRAVLGFISLVQRKAGLLGLRFV